MQVTHRAYERERNTLSFPGEPRLLINFFRLKTAAQNSQNRFLPTDIHDAAFLLNVSCAQNSNQADVTVAFWYAGLRYERGKL
jgi:hypothetical protein